ncbi:hypothetical protein, partial [Aliarcobacter butzleri]
TLPISENWLADFSNSRCKRDYIYDSGWIYSQNETYYMEQDSTNSYDLNGKRICYSTYGACSKNGFFYDGYYFYVGSFVKVVDNSANEGSITRWAEIKRTQPRTEYKAFSSF